MTTGYAYSDRFLEHAYPGHPERPDRLRAIMQLLRSSGTLDRMQALDFEPALLEQVTPVHQPRYLQLLRQLCATGGGHLDADTYVNADSYDIALLAAGAF